MTNISHETILHQKYIAPIDNIICDLKIFKEYDNPSNLQIAKIYRAINKSNIAIIRCQWIPNQKFYIYVSQMPSVVLQNSYNIFMNQTDLYVFAPFDTFSICEIEYNKRLLKNFMKCEQIHGTIICDKETEFIFISLDIPYTNLAIAWKEFITGGIKRKLIIDLMLVEQYFEIIPWKNNLRFKLVQGSEKEIEITYICNSKEQHYEWLNKIQHNKRGKFRGRLNLSQIITDEHMAYGICRLLKDITEVLPLIGTNIILLKEKSYINYVEQCLNEYEAYPIKDEELVDIFTQQSINEMNKYERMSLIGAGPYTFLNVYMTSKRGKYKDPITREICDIEKDFIFSNIFLDSFWKMENNEPEIIIENRNTKVYFNIKYINEIVNFWTIPDYRTLEAKYADITEMAIQLIIIKWNDKTIFSNIICGDDLLLYFSKIVLHAFEGTDIFEKAGDIDVQYQEIKKKIQMINSS